MKNSSLP